MRHARDRLLVDVPLFAVAADLYGRSGPAAASVLRRSDTARVWDNSRIDGPDEVALFAGGVPMRRCRWPAWTPDVILERLGR